MEKNAKNGHISGENANCKMKKLIFGLIVGLFLAFNFSGWVLASPNVTLISPNNTLFDEIHNKTFICNSSDSELANSTLYVWNSTHKLVNRTTMNISGTNNQSEFEFELPYDGDFYWNCQTCNTSGNCSFSASNFSLKIWDVLVTLNSPANSLYTNEDSASFNCSAETANDLALVNITFRLWNSTSLVNYSTKLVSGTDNSSLFSYTFSKETRYYWNCQAFNNISNSTYASANRTLVFDESDPEVELVSPADDYSSAREDTDISFKYNVIDNFEIDECELLIDGDSKESSPDDVENDTTETIVYSFGDDGTYDWKVRCTDESGNVGNSPTRTIDIQPKTTSGSGGTGTTGQYYFTPTTNSTNTASAPNSTQTSPAAYTVTGSANNSNLIKTVKRGDKISLVIPVQRIVNSTNGTNQTTFYNESHSITVTGVDNKSANLTIASRPINVSLIIGDTRKFNLTSPDYYDLYIKLNNITNQTVNLTVSIIKEPISAGIFSSIGSFSSDTFNKIRKFVHDKWIWIAIIAGVILLILINDIIISRILMGRRDDKDIKVIKKDIEKLDKKLDGKKIIHAKTIKISR